MLDLNEFNKRMRLAALADISDGSADGCTVVTEERSMNTTRCSCPTCRGVPPRPAPLPSVRSEILLTVVICVIWALMFLAVLGYMDMADARVGGLASELKR